MAISKAIKYVFLIMLLLVVLIGAGSFIFYKYYLPEAIAEAISSDSPEPMAFLPQKVQTKIVSAKKAVNSKLDDAPEVMESLGLTFDDLIIMVDRVNPDDVMKTLDELDNTNLKNTNQVFDIGLKNMKIEGYDLAIFKPLFLKKAKLAQVKKGLKMIKENNMATSISVPVAKATVKQILADKRDKIDVELEKIN